MKATLFDRVIIENIICDYINVNDTYITEEYALKVASATDEYAYDNVYRYLLAHNGVYTHTIDINSFLQRLCYKSNGTETELILIPISRLYNIYRDNRVVGERSLFLDIMTVMGFERQMCNGRTCFKIYSKDGR